MCIRDRACCPAGRCSLTPISLYFNDTWHKYASCQRTLLKRFSRSKVKGHFEGVASRLTCYLFILLPCRRQLTVSPFLSWKQLTTIFNLCKVINSDKVMIFLAVVSSQLSPSDVVRPVFFLNSAHNFFHSDVTPWMVSPGAVPLTPP